MADTLLVITREPEIRQVLASALSQHAMHNVEGIDQAMAAVRDLRPDLVLLDQGRNGLATDLLQRLRSVDANLPVVVLFDGGFPDHAIPLLKLGAAECVAKPVLGERLRLVVDNLLDQRRPGRARRTGNGMGLVANSPAMKRVMSLVQRVATAPSTSVLIQGEAGAGQDSVAQAIHERSPRAAGRLVTVNCSALSGVQAESELFGFEKPDGKDRLGLLDTAHGGTLFFDEIAELPLPIQARLLRMLQERRFRRVGGGQDIDLDLRVIAASSRDLRQEIAAGRLRQDLYFCLRVVPIRIPPLRERSEDILALADQLLASVAPALNRPQLRLSVSAREAMRRYAWPGNIRELANAIERAVIVCDSDEIGISDLCMDEHLPREAPTPTAAPARMDNGGLAIPPGERNLSRIEAVVIRAAMEDASGRKSKAAEALGINRTTLYNKLRELNLLVAKDGDSSGTWPAPRGTPEPG